ncbi:MAG TPA: hypothetical protein VG269_22280 [Tepidisphaeraceae bacterium]|jgi:hypothetical protein|nr:hypothetical protein [Tepidisphaeraceae bacterium]
MPELDTLGKTRGGTTDVSLDFSPTGAPAVKHYDPASHGHCLVATAIPPPRFPRIPLEPPRVSP